MTLWGLSAVDLAGLLIEREVSSREAVEACLERIAEREPVVRAWAALDPEAALAAADRCDAGPVRGPLHGLPIAVKDLFDTTDYPTAYGSPGMPARRPQRDAAIVEGVRAAGAVVLGKTVTSELGHFTAGATRNPHRLDRTPGGSSSGSAAAVADGMAPLALATQTAGSVIRPASFCGIVGFKPSFGRWSGRGLRSLCPSFDTPGVMGRTVADVELLSMALGGADGPSAEAEPALAVVRPADWRLAEPATAAALAGAADAIGAGGIADLPPALAGAQAACRVLIEAEIAASLAAEAATGDARAAELLAGSPRPSAATIAEARTALTAGRSALSELFADRDAIVTAAVLGEAPPSGRGTGDPVFCRLWTGLGCPAVSVPMGLGPAGLPIAVQVVGRPGADRVTLAAAAWLYEHATDLAASVAG